MNRSIMQLLTAQQAANAQLQLQTQQNQAVQKAQTNALKYFDFYLAMEQNLKNQLFTNVATQLSVECQMYNPPYHPQSNRRPEGIHNFCEVCMSKHVSKSLEWSQVVPLAWAAYKFLPNEHSKESPFTLCLVEILLSC